MANYLDKEQEDINLALAISLSVQSQQDNAFFTDNDITNRNRETENNMDGRKESNNGKSNTSTNMATRVNTGQTSTFRPTGQGNERFNVERQPKVQQNFPIQQPYSTSRAPRQTQSTSSQNIPPSSLSQSLPYQLANQLYNKIKPNVCAGCNGGIFGDALTAMNTQFHPGCFKCAACQSPFSGQFFPKGDPPLPYHKECAEQLFNPRCCLCSDILRGRYMTHAFFKEETYCVEHNDVRGCFSCNRKEPISGLTYNHCKCLSLSHLLIFLIHMHPYVYLYSYVCRCIYLQI